MARLTGRIIDKATGEPVEARVQVIGPNGNFSHPSDALLKVGTGAPFFYSDGTFGLDVGRGKVKIVAERGTEYVPAEITVDSPLQGAVAVELELERWVGAWRTGLHPGNTHIHYDEKEQRPDDRLSLDPRVEDLRMTAISILKRWELEYATNKYAPGFLNEFSSTHYYVQCGEENRHNALGSHSIGYGHVMFLNIRNVVHPVSRGLLVDAFDPDYPPLSYACDDTRRQGGIVIWCHNGQGWKRPSRRPWESSMPSTCSIPSGWTPSTTSTTGCSTRASSSLPPPAPTGSLARQTGSTPTQAAPSSTRTGSPRSSRARRSSPTGLPYGSQWPIRSPALRCTPRPAAYSPQVPRGSPTTQFTGPRSSSTARSSRQSPTRTAPRAAL